MRKLGVKYDLRTCTTQIIATMKHSTKQTITVFDGYLPPTAALRHQDVRDVAPEVQRFKACHGQDDNGADLRPTLGSSAKLEIGGFNRI